MELKSVDKDTSSERYVASPGEISRARIGLKSIGREEDTVSLPQHGTPEGSDKHISRGAAEYVVVGNLALLQNVDPALVDEFLGSAKQTVVSGLNALEEGSRSAALATEERLASQRR